MKIEKLLHYPAIISITLPLVGFALILSSLNLFQYYKIKNNIAAANLEEISQVEVSEIHSFFQSVSSRLKIVREWGKNGLLQIDDTVGLNRKFFPIIKNQDQFSGLLLADSRGKEYYLYRSENGLITRTISIEGDSTRMTWQRWVGPDQVVEEWQDESQFDLHQRPWFVDPEKNSGSIFWTGSYTFFQSGKLGSTASVSWWIPEKSDQFMVFGLDILVDDVKKLLAAQEKKRHGILILVNNDAQYFIESSLPGSIDFEDTGAPSTKKNLIIKAIHTWREENKSSQKVFTFTYNKQNWLAQFHPLVKENTVIIVGVVASEEDLAAGMKRILFNVDLIDFLVAAGGGMIMLFLAWRYGRTHALSVQKNDTPKDRLKKLINQGEGEHLEFKSTVRYNLKSDKVGKEIELAWLKAVSAFLNSDGGTVLLGIADDGSITGLEHDNFDSNDRCLLHIKNLINQHIGAEFSSLLRLTLVQPVEHQVVMIDCEKSEDPVFLKVGKDEGFYIRSGPSNTRLTPSQMISYLEQHRS